MGSDTDELPQLDEADFADTIVLTDSDVMATREMRQLLDPNAGESGDPGDKGVSGDDGEDTDG
jgi:hypothetical protein